MRNQLGIRNIYWELRKRPFLSHHCKELGCTMFVPWGFMEGLNLRVMTEGI
jgi:hypothetical protein